MVSIDKKILLWYGNYGKIYLYVRLVRKQAAAFFMRAADMLQCCFAQNGAYIRCCATCGMDVSL